MSEGASLTARLHITGRVQGVGYRWSMVQEAKRLGVNGWVRNRLDGSVEAVVSGAPPVVEALIDWARTGPPLARVEGVVVEVLEVLEGAPVPNGFEQR